MRIRADPDLDTKHWFKSQFYIKILHMTMANVADKHGRKMFWPDSTPSPRRTSLRAQVKHWDTNASTMLNYIEWKCSGLVPTSGPRRTSLRAQVKHWDSNANRTFTQIQDISLFQQTRFKRHCHELNLLIRLFYLLNMTFSFVFLLLWIKYYNTCIHCRWIIFLNMLFKEEVSQTFEHMNMS